MSALRCNSFRMTVLAAIFVLAAHNSFSEMTAHNGFQADADGSPFHCLSCHDGATSKHIDSCLENCGPETSHPILKQYPPPGKEREYAPVSVLSAKGIKLQDNRITCVSCHDLHKSTRHLLVMDSGLCSTCHIEK